MSSNKFEFEKLLINCQCLSGLFLIYISRSRYDWNSLLDMLAKSSPTSLYKFIFPCTKLKLSSLKSFFDKWKGRHPMLLHTIYHHNNEYFDLFKKYEAKGIIKKFDNSPYGNNFEGFEWIQ